MASSKTAGTWADLQESLTRVRQNYGILSRSQWDDLIARTSYENTLSEKHPHMKSKPHLPSLRKDLSSSGDLDKKISQGQNVSRVKRKGDPAFNGKPLVKRQEHHAKRKTQLQPEALIYCFENQQFACKFVDSLISEILPAAILQDVVIETLTASTTESLIHPSKLYKKRLTQDGSVGEALETHSRLLVDELLAEVVQSETVPVVRSAVKIFVDDHLLKAAVSKCVDEAISSIIQTELPSLIQEIKEETHSDHVLEDLTHNVIDEELRDIISLVFSDYEEQHNNQLRSQISLSAKEHLIHQFLLEHLSPLIVVNKPAELGKERSLALLDSFMLDILVKQQLSIHQCQQNVLHNDPLRRLHHNTTRKIVLEAVLTQLHASLDGDMEEILEYERSCVFR